MFSLSNEQLAPESIVLPFKCGDCLTQLAIASKVADLISDRTALLVVGADLMSQRLDDYVSVRVAGDRADKIKANIRQGAGLLLKTLNAEIASGQAAIMANAAACDGKSKPVGYIVNPTNPCAYSRVYDNYI